MSGNRIAPWSLLALGALAALGGCGEQDLYRPPASPYAAIGRVTLPGQANDVAVLDNYAYVPMEQGGLQMIDIADPSHPRLVRRSWSDQRMKSIVAARVYDATGAPFSLAFVAIGVEGLSTFDISSPDTLIEKPQEWNGYYTESVHLVPAEVVTAPFRLFIADGRRGVAVLFQDLENRGGTRFRDGVNHRSYTVGHATGVAYAGECAYVADDQMGVSAVSAADLDAGGSLQLIDNLDTPGTAVDIATDGDYVYVADGAAGLHVLRIGADRHLERVTSLALSGDCRDIALHDGIAFLAAEDAGLYIVDVRHPESPRVAGQVPSAYAVGVDVGANAIVCVADRDEGLIVFRNPDIPADFTAPAAVTDLRARLLSLTAVALTWAAPGDDGRAGTAALYDLRRASTPLADSNWTSAEEIVRRPLPLRAGTSQSVEIAGLAAGHTYHFALRTRDAAGNWSPISNPASARMTLPALSAGAVAPDSGDVATLFTYSVVYTDPEGDAPAVASVLIDNVARAMAPAEATPDYASGARFVYATTLGLGSHQYSFAFDDGHGPLVTTAAVGGPRLPPDPFDFTMRRIVVAPGASFTLGSPLGEIGRDPDETPVTVTLTRDYEVSEIEVTQTLYRTIRDANPSWFQGLPLPVSDVSWYDAIAFCNALSRHYAYTPAYTIADEVYNEQGELISARVAWDSGADGFRLPTEAEWEYACRAGSSSALANGDLSATECETDPRLAAIGWYCGNSDLGAGPRTHDVGRKEPNALGLYDLHGNVWEWCWDRYAEYESGPLTDPRGPAGEIGDPRVRRGGHWESPARECRSASRAWFYPGSADHTTGFRVARNAP